MGIAEKAHLVMVDLQQLQIDAAAQNMTLRLEFEMMNKHSAPYRVVSQDFKNLSLTLEVKAPS